MNEKGLIEQVLRILNANYSNIYVVDIPADIVYIFDFTVTNSLIIKERITYTDFIDLATKFIHKDDLSSYFDSLSLNKLEMDATKGTSEQKIKYRKLCETGEYRWYVNIINYLPFENHKLIFMMSEDINERLVDSEENSIKLETEIVTMKNTMSKENESISNALYQINTALDNNMIGSEIRNSNNTRDYINSVFNNLSFEHPELNKAIVNKLSSAANYRKPSILIVDDSSIIRNSLKRIFINDFNIIMAKNGEEAISIIGENIIKYDETKENIVGILLDLVMPVSDGFDVLNYLERNSLFNRIPVAIISGDETRETRKRVYEYDIVDMLEKPFNTDTVRRRIKKIINLHISSNNLQNVVSLQQEKLDTVDNDNVEGIKNILNMIVKNVLDDDSSFHLKMLAKVVTTNLGLKYVKYNINPRFVDAIVNNIALYNIGAIAMRNDVVITSATIREEINYGLDIINAYIQDSYELGIATNIIKYSCEMYNGTGYPDNITGNNIPIEAQIVNIVVRLYNESVTKNFNQAFKAITETDSNKYNPELIDIIKMFKKELKDII